jgi:hypothetical protein
MQESPAGQGQPASESESVVTEWQIHLPHLYAPPLQGGQWSHDFAVHAIGQAGLGEGSIDPVLLGIQSG